GTDNSGGSTVTTTASYYLNGLPRSVSENSTTTMYSYDATGATAGLQSTTGAGTLTATYGYTDAEQPGTVTGGTLGAGVTMSVGYDDEQRPVSASYTNGPALSRTWNADSTLATQTLTAQGGGSVSSWAYAYDGMGRVTSAANNTASSDCVPSQPAAGLQCFTYDAAGRLATFHDSTAARAMAYDADGNRTGYGPGVVPDVPCVPATGMVCAKYNPDDSISQQSNGATWKSFVYAQPFGGVTNDGCSTYSYDGFDRMSSTSGLAGTSCAGQGTSNAYDIIDRQARRTDTSTGVTTTLGYAGLGSQSTSEATPTATTRYTVSPDGGTPLAVSTTGGVAQYLFDDGRGNISTTTSTTGALQCGLRYDPWGSFVNAVTSGGCTNAGGSTPSDMFYGAGRRDATTGTYQLGARTYDPGKAGFLNPDGYRTAPSSADLSVGTDPLTRDTYNYVNGDPINLVDPTGHMNAAEGGGGCGKLSNADCRRIEDYVANAVMVEYLNQANDAGIRAQQALDRAEEKRRHECDGFFGHVSCAANAVADVATTGVKVGVNFVGGAGAGLIDEATSIVTFGAYDPGFNGCAFGGGGVVGTACTAGRVTGRVGAEVLAMVGTGGAAEASDAVRAARGIEVLSNIASKARAVSKLRSVESGVADATRVERAVEEGSEAASAARTCSVNSFTGSTMVLLADGHQIPISKVKPGMKVLATDPATSTTAARRVEGVIVHSGEHTMVDLRFADGSKVVATDRHPFWDASTGQFTYAIDLRAGEQVREASGQLLTISKTRSYTAVLTAYNLTVDGIHTYYAGTTPVLVHNSCADRVASAVERHGGVEAEGGYSFATRQAARQAASEIAGDLGSNPLAIRASEFRGGPWWMRASDRVIGRSTARGNIGWRDDFLGHTFSDDILGPHVNVWENDWGTHLFYPGVG
ncbi:MAG: hypothetical protein QOG34_24, partial [Frankiaceae bacterium]|nr:hypothetical protein [Frankiaceae bacterium]